MIYSAFEYSVFGLVVFTGFTGGFPLIGEDIRNVRGHLLLLDLAAFHHLRLQQFGVVTRIG